MDEYQIMQPPFTLKFRELSKRELNEYFQWFFEVSSQRVDQLQKAVNSSPGFEDWRPNFTTSSLGPLGRWFATSVNIRRRTEEEIAELRGRSKFPIEIPNEELTNETFSIAVDVGIYLAEVLRRNHPTLRWEQPLGNKRDIDYGQPVLVGFGPVPFNPIRMVITLAYGLAQGKRTGEGLIELYEIWSKMIRAT